MLSLIKNELFKLFHKKSTFVFLIIALLYVILTNVIYRYYYSDVFVSSANYYEDKNYALEYINNYDPAVDNLSDYSYYLALLDCYGWVDDYDFDSWQYKVIMEKYLYLAQNYYYESHVENSNAENISAIKDEMFKMLQAIEKSDWQYFANLEKEELEESISNYEILLAGENINQSDKVEYQMQLYIANEQLKLVNARLEDDIVYANDYLNTAIDNINNSLYSMAEYLYNPEPGYNYDETLKQYNENQYILANKVDNNDEQTLRGVLVNFFNEYSFLILIFIIMIAGGIVSDEFNKGTIKSLLTTPYKRTTILLSKYITALLMIIFIVLAILLMQFVIGGIFLGFSSLSVPVATYNLTTGNIDVLNVFSYFLVHFIAYLPQLILLVTLAFACSTILNNTAFAIALTFCGMIGAEIINSLALVYDIKFLNYFVTTNWDFTTHLFGGTSPFGLSLTHSIIICLIYLIIMLAITFIVFNKKDIKNV